MSKSIAAAGALAVGLLVISAGTATAQGLPGTESAQIDPASLDPAALLGAADVPDDYLGSVGEILPGSVTGSLPGYATGPMGSVANAFCNAGSVAGSAGIALPEAVDPVCTVVPALAQSGDYFGLGDYDGSVRALVGGVPYVGSALSRVVPTHSAAEAVDGAVSQVPTDSAELGGAMPVESLLPDLPAS